MNIIKYDTYFSPIITMDNTDITMDSTEITFDNLSNLTYGFRMDVIPLIYDTDITIKLRSYNDDSIVTLTPECKVDNGILKINLDGFTPLEENNYEVTISNETQTLWYGLAMYTTKNIQNYSFE